jgi:transposase
LPWPGNSPDMNPIENLWVIVKKRLKKINITTKVQLIENLIQIWHHDDEVKNKCSVLIESMQRRIELLIKNKGMHTKY